LHAQFTFTGSSRLGDSSYVEHQIKNISDADLVNSLNLTGAGLRRMREAAAKKSYAQAYEEWGKYWAAKKQPIYITQNDELLIDTELLKDYAAYRHYLQGHPVERDTLLSRANAILRNMIYVWTDEWVDFGPEVDFNREIGQSGKYGFHYWAWARPLNDAFVSTGNQEYLRKFDALFNRWYEQRNEITRSIPKFDVVYYELGLGTRNTVFIEHYLMPYGGRTARTHERMLKTMLAAGRWLYELERWEGYRPGNWQIRGSYMLVQIALVFPEFKEASGWLQMGLQRLVEHLSQDFFPDGGHSERAPRNYTLGTYVAYRNLQYLLLAYHVRPDVPPLIHAPMGRTLDWWITMLAPTGEIPSINDSQRALFPTMILEDGATLFSRREVFGVMRNLLGYPRAPTAPLPSFTSRNMLASGFAVMRTDWTRDALYMNLNYGKFAGFHTHNDMLDFEIYAYGKALAVDAGIGTTYDDPLYVPWYQSSRAHNMVVVNDSNIVRDGTEGKGVVWGSLPTVDYFSAEHDGYMKYGVSHTRRIAFVKPTYWFILDELACKQGGDTLSWYLHSPTRLIASGEGFRSETAPGLLVLPLNNHLARRTGFGRAASTVDLNPGRTDEINWIRFDRNSVKDSVREFAVLLYPFKDSLPGIQHVLKTGRKIQVATNDFSDILLFPSGIYDDGALRTDAKFVWIRSTSRGPTRYAVVEGTYLTYEGREVWKAKGVRTEQGVIGR
jgi:hypothetical protein